MAIGNWIFKSIKFYMLTRSGRLRHITMKDFLETGPSIAEILRFFDFSNDHCRHLGCSNLLNFIGRQCLEAQTHNHAKYRQNRSFRCGYILWFFPFSRWRPPPFWFIKFAKLYWLIVHVWRAQTHHCTKFRQNRLFHCGDIAIFRIFKMAAAAMLDFWNR